MRDINDKRTEAIHAADTEFAETVARVITEASARRAEKVNAAYREYYVEHERRMTVWERGEPVTVRGRPFDIAAIEDKGALAIVRELELQPFPAVVKRQAAE